MSTATSALRRTRPNVLSDLVAGTWARDAVLVVAAAALTGLAAQLSIRLPHTVVPITGQTFAVLLTGAALGSRRGLASMGIYLLAGGFGLPWFTGHSSGWSTPSFGYVIGFVVASAVVGYLAERGGDRTPLRTVATMALGTVLVYAVGVPYLALSLHLGTTAALDAGMRPFLLGDGLKVLLAAGLLPGAWYVVRRVRDDA